MNLYFGDLLTTISTIWIALVLIYIGFVVSKRKTLANWGKKVAILAISGLILCCLVATRDGYHLSVQATMDSNIAAGLFTLDSIQSTICSIGGAIIAFCSLSSIFIRKQKYWRVMFIVLSATMIVKMLVIEISRITM